MTDDKELSINFFKSKDIEARHFPKQIEGKKADFELYLQNRLFGYCALKSIVDYDLSGERPDPTYNKIQSKIHEAAKQLKTVNAAHSIPNIIFFINHSQKVGWQDLWYVLSGQATPPNHPGEPIDMRYLNRLMGKGDLAVIDYFIWADMSGSNISFCINRSSPFTVDLKKTISSKAYERKNKEYRGYLTRSFHADRFAACELRVEAYKPRGRPFPCIFKGEFNMRWNHHVSYFFGGAFLINAIPHFVSGVTGHPFQSPFASPPGQGLSSVMVNVLWGALNLTIGYLLICRVGQFELRRTRHVLIAGFGGLLMAVMLAHAFGRFYGGL